MSKINSTPLEWNLHQCVHWIAGLVFLSHQTRADLISVLNCFAVSVILSYSGGHFSQLRAEAATQGLAVLAASHSLLVCLRSWSTACLSRHVAGIGCGPGWILPSEHRKCKPLSCLCACWFWFLFASMGVPTIWRTWSWKLPFWGRDVGRGTITPKQ